MKLFKNRFPTSNPEIIIQGKSPLTGEKTFEAETIYGKYFRVVPANMHEIRAVQFAEHGVDRFAIATRNRSGSDAGHGVILSAAYLKKIDA